MTAREVPVVELVERGGRLIVSTQYTFAWRNWAFNNGGEWSLGSRAWVFHPDQRAAVEAALAEIFGGDDDE
jgi:hypothetical protein